MNWKFAAVWGSALAFCIVVWWWLIHLIVTIHQTAPIK